MFDQISKNKKFPENSKTFLFTKVSVRVHKFSKWNQKKTTHKKNTCFKDESDIITHRYNLQSKQHKQQQKTKEYVRV